MSELRALDELSIPAPNTGRPLQRLSVTTQFQLSTGATPESRRAAMSLMLELLSAGDFGQWLGPGAAHRPLKYRPGTGGGSSVARIAAGLSPLIEEPDAEFSLSLLQQENPPRSQADLLLHPVNLRKPRNSHLTVAVPPSVALGDAEAHVRQVLDWAGRLRPEFGTSGFALLAELGMAHQSRGAAWHWWQHYPGLDVAPFNFRTPAGQYQSVNWLTLLGETALGNLGGADELDQRLHAEATARGTEPPTLMSYPGGALIRASALPQLGDRGQGEIPAGYRAVNAAIRAIRFEDYPTGRRSNIGFIDAPRTRNLGEATLEWVRRFDD